MREPPLSNHVAPVHGAARCGGHRHVARVSASSAQQAAHQFRPAQIEAEVRLEGEVLSHDAERAAQALHAIRDVFESTALEARAHAEVDVQQLYTGYELTESNAIVGIARRAFASVDGGGVSTFCAAAAARMPTNSTFVASPRVSSASGRRPATASTSDSA
jgi:hypothetical protein